MNDVNGEKSQKHDVSNSHVICLFEGKFIFLHGQMIFQMTKETCKGTVSVVMCTYNGERYLREQLDSILAQTYPIHEIIIQDDGSTDRTLDIADGYAAKYSNVRVIRNDHNLGFNENFKDVAMKATGDYVAISDQDDVWYHDKIEKLVDAIGTHDMSFCCHDRGLTPDKTVFVSPQYSQEALPFIGFAGHTMLLKRAFVQDKRNWIDYIYYDWGLAINAQLHGGIVRVDEALNFHRTHDDSAFAQEVSSHGVNRTPTAAIAPYLHGVCNYRRLQRKPNWNRLYTYIYEHSNTQRLRLIHTISGLMLSRNPFALLRLCLICLRHRHTIYFNEGAHGLMGLVRGFCWPLIFAYNNVQYDFKK